MLKYAFNGFLFSQRQTGVMRFAKEILKRLDTYPGAEKWVLVVPQYAEYAPNLERIKIVKYGDTHGNLWEQTDFLVYIKKHNFESVNFNNTIPLLRPGIVVIHDIAYKIHPEFADSLHGRVSNLYHQIAFRRAARSKKPIITVTNFSKIQLIEHYDIDPARISVIGNAWQHLNNVEIDASILTNYHLKEKAYYFSLGSLSKMKNTKWIYEVAKRNPKELFVLAGAKPKNTTDNFSELNNVLRIGFVTDEQIIALIRNCKAFIYPSIYDGFGIPPLEALSQGADVVCSMSACLPEVYRNSVHYINPYDYDVDINRLIKEKIAPPEEVLSRYSWDKSAKEFYKVLKEYECK